METAAHLGVEFGHYGALPSAAREHCSSSSTSVHAVREHLASVPFVASDFFPFVAKQTGNRIPKSVHSVKSPNPETALLMLSLNMAQPVNSEIL